MTTEQDPGAGRLERIWDPATRLLKWGLAGAVAGAWWLGWTMGFDTARLHGYVGYAAGGVLAARLLWGLIGPRPARLSDLIGSAFRAPGYARTVFSRRPSLWPGHNPLGSLSVLALFTSIALQVATGLMAYSDSFFEGGPLHGVVSEGWTLWANSVHAANARVLLALVLLHLAAVLFYALWKRENLLRPMITGWKRVDRREAP